MQDWLLVPRCFAAENPLVPGSLTLSKEEGRHLSRVRRIGSGKEVSVLNGMGQVGRARITAVDRDRVDLEIAEVLTASAPAPALTLLIGGLKQSAWDEVLKHAVELGVNRIVRVQSDHAVSDLQADKLEKKTRRWVECMIEACKQSGNPWLPQLDFADAVSEAVGMVAGVELQLFAGMQRSALPLEQVIADDTPEEIAMWVGPEGDFSEMEYQQIQSAGARQISLGPRILRAETAALALLARLRLQ